RQVQMYLKLSPGERDRWLDKGADLAAGAWAVRSNRGAAAPAAEAAVALKASDEPDPGRAEAPPQPPALQVAQTVPDGADLPSPQDRAGRARPPQAPAEQPDAPGATTAARQGEADGHGDWRAQADALDHAWRQAVGAARREFLARLLRRDEDRAL